MATAPHLLKKTALVSEDDYRKFVEHVATRMGVDASADIRPALLVHTSLATIRFVIDRWLNRHDIPTSPIHIEMEIALRLTLAGFH